MNELEQEIDVALSSYLAANEHKSDSRIAFTYLSDLGLFIETRDGTLYRVDLVRRGA